MATTETIKIIADTEGALAGFSKVQVAGQQMAGRLQSIGGSMVSLGQKASLMTAPISIGFAAVGKIAGDFENSMQRLQAVSGATGKEFEKLRDQAKQLGSTTEFSAKQAADAQGFLAMAGFEVNEITAAMPGLLNLATAGQLDLARAADIASNVLTGYGFEASKINYVNDVMAKTATSANTNISQLGEAMKYAAPIAKSAGLDFTEAATIIGKLSDAGIQGSMAGTSLRGAISRLLKPTKDTTETLNRLGVSVTNSSGEMRSLINIIGDLERAGANTTDMITIFGQEAGTGMSALLGQGSASLQELKDKLDAANGSATKMADTMRGGLQGQMASMQSALEGLAIAIADTGLLNMMTLGIDLATKAVQALAQLPKPVLQVVTGIGLVAVALGPVLIATGSVISAIGTIGAAIPVVTSALGGLSVVGGGVAAVFAGMTAPVWGTLAAFAALGAGIGVLAANWDRVTQFMGDVWLGMTVTVQESAEYWGATIRTALFSITQTISSWGTSLWNAGAAAIGNLVDGMRSRFDSAIAWFKSQLQAFRNLLPGSEPRDRSSPLANLASAGTATLQNFSQGFAQSNAASIFSGALGQARNQLTVPVPAGASAGGGGIVINDNRTIQINGGATDRGDDWILDVLRRSDRELLELIERAQSRLNRGRA